MMTGFEDASDRETVADPQRRIDPSGVEQRQSKQFFFEKKNQKTFASLAYAEGEDRDNDRKVFCVRRAQLRNRSNSTSTWNAAECWRRLG
jgi:hypothetical protein